MIEFIIGDIVEKLDEKVILRTNNIGYNIIMPKSSIAMLGEKYDDGKNVMIHTHLYIREDAMVLYGFCSEIEKIVFGLLLGVNKVGPKAAISVLSAMSVEELINNVLREDAANISKMSQGVGLKTAQKIILDLKDKLAKLTLDTSIGIGEQDKVDPFENEISDKNSDVIDALCVLGYHESLAKGALKKAVLSGVNDDDLLKEALKYL